MPEQVNSQNTFSGSGLFTSQNQSPGHITQSDALNSNDIAQMVNDKAKSKFRNTEHLSIPDIQSPGLTSAPGEIVGRGENKIPRPRPFGDIDGVKAAGALFKAALFDPIVEELNLPSKNPSSNVQQAKPNLSLDKFVTGVPRLGDYKPNNAPVDDQRGYDGSLPFRQIGGSLDKNKPYTELTPQQYGQITSNPQDVPKDSVSRKYLADESGPLKVAFPIPEPILQEDDWQNPQGDDDYNMSTIAKKVQQVSPVSHVARGTTSVRGSLGDKPKKKEKKGTFLSFFMKDFYGRSL